jgi:hypothetical protein
VFARSNHALSADSAGSREIEMVALNLRTDRAERRLWPQARPLKTQEVRRAIIIFITLDEVHLAGRPQ